MSKNLKAFKIKVNGKILDYRVGQDLNLKEIEKFFSKKYVIEKIWSAPRHVLGILRKDGNKLFLKLAKSEGIGAMTQIEYKWNDIFNSEYPNSLIFRVPKNFERGFFKNLFYEVMEYFEGELLCGQYDSPEKIDNYIPQIIELTEIIQEIKNFDLKRNDYIKSKDYIEWFINKTKLWFEGIPENVIHEQKISDLLNIVVNESSILERRPRHGDFAPWHIIKMKNGLGLTDAEHAISDGIEYYDICYFIQRVHSELGGTKIAEKIFNELLRKNYDKKKLRIVLAARSVGGFLDESLKPTPDYTLKNQFKNWVLNIY